jgi:hypothetical protein
MPTKKPPKRTRNAKKASVRKLDKNFGEPVGSRIASALLKQGLFDQEAAAEAAFHMVDWGDDLLALARLYQHPERFTDKEIYEEVLRFVVHAPAHLAAAQLIIAGYPVEDVFDLGAVKGTGKPKRMPGGPYPDPLKKPKRAPCKS